MIRVVTAFSSHPVVIMCCASCLFTARVRVALVLVIAVYVSACFCLSPLRPVAPFGFVGAAFPSYLLFRRRL